MKVHEISPPITWWPHLKLQRAWERLVRARRNNPRPPCGFLSPTPSTSGHRALTRGASQFAIEAISSESSTRSAGAVLLPASSPNKRGSDRARFRSFSIFKCGEPGQQCILVCFDHLLLLRFFTVGKVTPRSHLVVNVPTKGSIVSPYNAFFHLEFDSPADGDFRISVCSHRSHFRWW